MRGSCGQPQGVTEQRAQHDASHGAHDITFGRCSASGARSIGGTHSDSEAGVGSGSWTPPACLRRRRPPAPLALASPRGSPRGAVLLEKAFQDPDRALSRTAAEQQQDVGKIKSQPWASPEDELPDGKLVQAAAGPDRYSAMHPSGTTNCRSLRRQGAASSCACYVGVLVRLVRSVLRRRRRRGLSQERAHLTSGSRNQRSRSTKAEDVQHC